MFDPISGQPYASGGLNLGDYFDATNDEAAAGSYQANGLLFAGRYRFVQVDSGATAANVKTGTVGYVRSGQTMKSVVVLTAGSGQTPGSYTVQANAGSGGGSGASISVTVGASGAVTSVSVINAGFGYVSPPTFTLVTGGTPGTVLAELGITMNLVTSADIAALGPASTPGIGPVRPVIFLNSITPGNYGFVQELGVATVLTAATAAQTPGQNAVAQSSSPAGLMVASTTTYSVYNLGVVLDTLSGSPLINTPFKILLETPVVQD
jgi:hypothetical protein